MAPPPSDSRSRDLPPGSLLLARFDASGAAVWARLVSGSNSGTSAYADALVALNGGDVVVQGGFQGTGTVTLGSSTFGGTGGANWGLRARYAADGLVTWARNVEGASLDQHHAAGGTLYASGIASGTSKFGAGEANETSMTAHSTRGYAAAFDPATGAFEYVRRLADGDATTANTVWQVALAPRSDGSVAFALTVDDFRANTLIVGPDSGSPVTLSLPWNDLVVGSLR